MSPLQGCSGVQSLVEAYGHPARTVKESLTPRTIRDELIALGRENLRDGVEQAIIRMSASGDVAWYHVGSSRYENLLTESERAGMVERASTEVPRGRTCGEPSKTV